MRELMLPVGVEDFGEIRRGDFYYVDKTSLIEQVLTRANKVTLFTRPRRFGKTLNMSMLQHFFEIGTDPALFDGLYISDNQKLCGQYMGKYPVISISLKEIEAATFDEAKFLMSRVINTQAMQLQMLKESDKLTSLDKRLYDELVDRQMEMDTIIFSLKNLTKLLEKHYDQQVIVLIDEYDVPLAKAYENGYYDEMVRLLRGVFGSVLKTNSSLKFAVLTGCLRIAKESIFTGLNNFKVYSITNSRFDEAFGFTDDEVKAMLSYYQQEEQHVVVKEWYDGYRFGKADVYCPWDVINFCSDFMDDPTEPPCNYWMNTSGNEVIKHFIESVNEPQKLTKDELEQLVNGETVVKDVNEAITYKDLYSTIDNLWSTLFMTGYLTQRGRECDGRYRLAIPNREIQSIIIKQILTLFQEEARKDYEMAERFFRALAGGRAAEVETLLKLEL